jgi:hypothetical protein
MSKYRDRSSDGMREEKENVNWMIVFFPSEHGCAPFDDFLPSRKIN